MENKDLQMIDDFIHSRQFRVNCPTAHKTLAYSIKYISSILNIADRVNSNTNSNKPIYFAASYNQFAKEYNKYFEGALSKKTMFHNINILAYHKFIIRVDDRDAPAWLLKRVIDVQKDSNYNKYNTHVQIYMIPRFSNTHISEIESQAIKWVNNGYKMDSFTYETLIRCEGFEAAAEIYPQYKHLRTKEATVARIPGTRSNNRSLKIEDYIIRSIRNSGYCVISNIPSHVGYSKDVVNKYLPEVKTKYNLVKVRCSNRYKDLFNILDMDGKYPFIFIDANDVIAEEV